jgi:predicted nucleic acid-binding Zn ribbon protein
MARYCPVCGRSIPLDAKICPYCSKSIALNEGLIIPEPEKKKDNKTVLIVVLVVILLLVVPIAIAATVYVYVSGMIGPAVHNLTPTVVFSQNETANTLTVSYVKSYSVSWMELEVQGNCNTSGLGTYVQIGDTITDCSGTIIIYYIITGERLGSWTFT